MDILSIPDLSLSECLEIVNEQFDCQAIAETLIDEASVIDYYRQSGRGYRLFHSKDGAMHVALNRDGEFTTDGYLGQVELLAERLQQTGAQRVLEVGCGVGYNSRHLAERAKLSIHGLRSFGKSRSLCRQSGPRIDQRRFRSGRLSATSF